MKVRVTYKTPQMAVDETFTGRTADEVVAAMKKEVASHLGFALRLIVNGMSPLQFAQEVSRRYNDAAGRNLPIPSSCDEFMRLAQQEGIAHVVEAE